MLICHDDEYKEKDVDVEVWCQQEGHTGSDKVKVYELPEIEAACIIHKGPYEGFRETYTALMSWIEKNGYEITGHDREVYLTYDANDGSKNVTEIQFPVKKSQE
jgi:effector-binding domain-containing protein